MMPAARLKSDWPNTKRRMASIERAIALEPLNAHEIAGAVFCSIDTARDYIKHMHTAGMIHIAGWRMRKGIQNKMLPLYRAGKCRDKPRPPLAKVKAKRQSERWFEIKDEVSAKRNALKIKPRRDPMIAALYGMAA